jgi:hypothetical protein
MRKLKPIDDTLNGQRIRQLELPISLLFLFQIFSYTRTSKVKDSSMMNKPIYSPQDVVQHD